MLLSGTHRVSLRPVRNATSMRVSPQIFFTLYNEKVVPSEEDMNREG